MAQQDIKQIRGASQGSILFLGTNSIVSENYDKLNWDQSTNIFTINGNVRITNGSQSSGYVLTSDTANVPYLNINQADFTTTATTYNDLVIDSNGNVMKNNIYFIGVNFESTGVTWNYVAPQQFKIFSIDNPSVITYNLLHNGTAYTLNNTIQLYDDLQITGVTTTGFLKLNAQKI